MSNKGLNIIDTIEVCSDCLMVIANDDWSAVDYGKSEEEADEKCKDIKEGIKTMTEDGEQLVPRYDSEPFFSWRQCDCCNALPGDRMGVDVLGKE